MTGARESTDEEHDEHADPEPGGCRPALHLHLRSLHRQRLRPHVLALWPLLVLHHPHFHIYLNLAMAYHMVTFLRETLVMDHGYDNMTITTGAEVCNI